MHASNLPQKNDLSPYKYVFQNLKNYTPSRSGGQIEGEGSRNITGETLAYFQKRIFEMHGKETPILAMGDFNDDPVNSSLTKYA